MSPRPTRMADRWQARAEPAPEQVQLYWHVLMRDQPQVRALAAVARGRLSGFSGLHFTPEQWLHLSVLRVGLTTDFAHDEVEAMVGQARPLLQRLSPVTFTLGQVLYHPEAITLGARPGDALDAVAGAVRQAAASTPARSADVTNPPWIPHVTLAYSTQDQPADPIIAALGRELPECPVTIDAIHLIAQHGPERAWNWQSLARIALGR
ncbi:MAG TPA: 2'-5' RNA ligase family protein [Streptosporangiaceae bacterium]|nr:2'-5' RNA ligase family protein [Streptosporangiaceae bacterium]